MKKSTLDKSTDSAWEEWGRRDPYFGVFTNPKFRKTAIDEHARREFFESGVANVDYVLRTICKYVDPDFIPTKVIDFGCGVGRMALAFAPIAENVVGVDVSASMLAEARRNCDDRQVRNVQLLRTDDDLSGLAYGFDLVHSYIVLQHIPVDRGRLIVSNLLRHLRPGGVGAIHLTYSKAMFASTHGISPPQPEPSRAPAPVRPDESDPEMQMNPYNMNQILFLMQSQGVRTCHLEFTDHGGELGVYLFFSVA